MLHGAAWALRLLRCVIVELTAADANQPAKYEATKLARQTKAMTLNTQTTQSRSRTDSSSRPRGHSSAGELTRVVLGKPGQKGKSQLGDVCTCSAS